MLVDFNPSRFQIEAVAIGNTANGQQHICATYLLCLSFLFIELSAYQQQGLQIHGKTLASREKYRTTKKESEPYASPSFIGIILYQCLSLRQKLKVHKR
jgi:hypothetical protein